jgi:hypothetical protein
METTGSTALELDDSVLVGRNLLKIEPKTTSFGCGLYEVGDTERCYVKLFITDTGYVVSNPYAASGEILMDVYRVGYEDGARAAKANTAPDWVYEEDE